MDRFRKVFRAASIKKARLYMTACGLYEAAINGQRVGDFVRAPGITDYRKRIQYPTYNVTTLLQDGENTLTVHNEILEQRPHEKGTFIILDVDKFKEVNDHYRHAVGDIVLSTLGQTLRNYFRENDIIGRIGGDEFVIYMCKTERQRWIFSFPKAG